MRLVLLGDPVEHSRSPAIHRAALAACGIEGTYRARRVDAEGVRQACREISGGRLDGANVTMPHKRVAARAADRLSDDARRANSVNTLVRRGDEVVGHTTDVEGIRAVWSSMEFGAERPVLLLGGGGAAGAALLALEGMDLVVSTRRPGVGARLAEGMGVVCREVPWGEPVAGAVVINATPLGMAGEALPGPVLEAASGLFDMVYGDTVAPSVTAARVRGIPATDGLAMLVAQAAASFELWTGLAAPRDVMERAARG